MNVLHALGLLEEAAEGVVAELAGDVLQRPQVIARPVGRGNQEEEQVDDLAVEAGEIDPLGADGHGAHQVVDAGVLGVGHGHAAADAGAAQFLAFENRLDDALELLRFDLPCPAQCLDHFADRPFLVLGVKLARGSPRGR